MRFANGWADTHIFNVRRVLCKPCGKVKRKQLEFLADNTHFTKRFAYFARRRCRQATIKDVAKELNLDGMRSKSSTSSTWQRSWRAPECQDPR